MVVDPVRHGDRCAGGCCLRLHPLPQPKQGDGSLQVAGLNRTYLCENDKYYLLATEQFYLKVHVVCPVVIYSVGVYE